MRFPKPSSNKAMTRTMISRQDAKDRGYKRYFLNTPCLHGHVSERMVSNKGCVECLLQNRIKYHHKNRDVQLDRMRLWHKTNSIKVRNRNSKWQSNNKEIVASISRNRRAMKKGSTGKHSKKDVYQLLNLQRYKCVCCGVKLSMYHVDHIVPLSRGGSNDKMNIQILCGTCNLQKHAKDPIVFMQEKGFLL